MDLSIHSGKRAFSVVWTTNTSVYRRIHESPVFSMENCDWSFSLEIEGSPQRAEQDWQLYLNKIRPADGHHIFIINISIEDENRVIECMNYARIVFTKPSSERILWRWKLQILANYPNIVLDGDVTFIVTLLSDYRHFDDLENEIVTHSSQTPNYLDISPCLDTLRSDFSKLLEDGLQTDVKLQCGERSLYAHKAVLMARSQVFAAMLQRDMLEKQRGSIEIVDITYSTLELFLKYLYTGTLPELNMDIASGLYEAGDKYDIETLKMRCSGFLKEHLKEDNACALLSLADAHCDEDLMEFVMAYIERKEILEKLKQKFSDEYPNLELDKMYESYKSSHQPTSKVSSTKIVTSGPVINSYTNCNRDTRKK